MRTYLVTGGAGFIGSNYIHYMFKKYGKDIRIINVDALTYAGNPENLEEIENNPDYDYTFVKADVCDREAISKIFAENDIHIHVPEGAVPKDGPSAGVAMTTALISCLTGKEVDANVAMTGEVTLRGKALPIGGLREKSLAALRSGIKTIVVPEDNKKDVSELPQEVKDNLKIVFMKCVDDALAVALVSKQA